MSLIGHVHFNSMLTSHCKKIQFQLKLHHEIMLDQDTRSKENHTYGMQGKFFMPEWM